MKKKEKINIFISLLVIILFLDLLIPFSVSAQTGKLLVTVKNADGSPRSNQYVTIYTQGKDSTGQPTAYSQVTYERTNDQGVVGFDLTPGTYVIKIEGPGYTWYYYNQNVSSGSTTNYTITLGRLIVTVKNADGSPRSNQYVTIYTQGKDSTGQPTAYSQVTYERTNDQGVVGFDLTPGTYVIGIDGPGYYWYYYNQNISSGATTNYTITLGRLIVTVKNADGSPRSNQYVSISTQWESSTGQPTVHISGIAGGSTNDQGIVGFDLTPGTYVIGIDGPGYYWYYYNQNISSGATTNYTITLGRLIVTVKNADGSPRSNQYVSISTQWESSTGQPTVHISGIAGGSTNDQGVVGFDLTPGTYVIGIDDKTIFNAIIESGKITKSDGINVFPPSGEGTAPSAPSNLFATSISNSQINLTWVDNSDSEDGFKIERKVAGGTYFEIKTLSANTTSYSDTGLNSNTTYYYRIRAYNSYGNSSYSNEVSVSTTSGDTLPPTVTVTYPQQNAILNTKNFTITGTTEPGATLTINNNSVSVGANGSFSYDAAISGPATFTIIAKDIAGNVTQFVLNVSLDTTPPILTVTEPHAFQEIYTQFVTVKGQTEKNAKVKINGVDITLNPDYSFSYSLQLTTQGANAIEVIAEDLAGNINTVTIPITYKKTANANTVIILQIGNPNALKNGETIKLDASPFIENGRTMVPVRFISEAFGATVNWEPPKTVTIIFRDTRIILQVGNVIASIAKKDTPAQRIILDTPPKIVGGRTFVPIRFIGEAFGAVVDWDSITKTIKITL
jgi:hypothetical protein